MPSCFGIQKTTRNLALSLMDDAQTKLFATEKDVNFAVNLGGLGRFRANVIQQQGLGSTFEKVEF